MPMLSGVRAKADLRLAAREVATALRETRSRALSKDHPTVFAIDLTGGNYRSDGSEPAHRLPRGVQAILFTTTEDRVTDTVGKIRFFPDGSSTGGGLRLVQADRQTELLVDWLTGRVSIDE